MITDMKPLIEINQQAIHLLYKELGVVNAVRFFKQFTQGYGNYTQERDDLFGNKSLDEIVTEIEKSRKK
ncbi:MAG: hypothetical protein IH585_20390 [Anaerolineaceae bacterium]|nr:hypothetical protein [Anaerolineaceae bacterium]